MKELNNKRHPLFNRSVKAKYPPGSTFKLVNGLIGMQEGVLTKHNVYPCHRGYDFGRVHVGCHHHSSPLGLHYAIATSCNAYFCYVFRNILENRRYPSLKDAYDEWREYVLSFGFGDKLGSDFLGEGTGYVPTREFYDKRYRRSWNALTVLSLSIGQGELGCTPLQMANLAATVANRRLLLHSAHRGRRVEGQDSLDTRFYERHYTKVDTKYFDEMVEGMWRGVNVDGTGRLAYLKDLDVCGKTGTAQNPRGADHSTFISFGSAQQSAHRHRRLCRTRRLRCRGGCAYRVAYRGDVSHGRGEASRTGGVREEQTYKLFDVWQVTAAAYRCSRA